MAGYLSVTDERELTTDGKAVVAKEFLRRSEYEGTVVSAPAWAGARTGQWLAPVYNPGARSLSLIRGGIMSAQFAGADYEIAVLGDSKTEGTGSDAGKRPVQGWPGVLRRALGAVEGFITAEVATDDDRWSSSNMNQGNADLNGLITVTPGTPSTATFTYNEPHTGGLFLIQCTAGGSVIITVDGGAPQTLAVAAGSGYQQVTPVVTGTGTHTYTITSDATINLRGFRPTFATPKLKITNLGRSGSTVTGWTPGYVPGVGLWDGFRAAVPAPDAVLCQIGTNAPSVTAPHATLWTAIVGVTDRAVVIAPGGIGAASDTTYAAMYLAVWNQADAHKLPLIDFRAVIGNNDEATARGLMSDALHENKYGYAYEAAAVRALIGVG